MSTPILGQPLNRIEGRLKVTGRANYAADNRYDRLAHAYGVLSPIAAGTIVRLDAVGAENAPGVLAVLHHRNIPRLHRCPDEMDEGLKAAEERTPLEDDTIYYAGQFVAIVVAETFEQARWAAHLVRAEYQAKPHALSLDEGVKQNGRMPRDDEKAERGDVERALASARMRVDETYVTPVEVHNAMELHSTIARWEGGRLIVDDSTQWVYGQPRSLAHVLGIPVDCVEVHAPFIGGGFGSKLFLWPHAVLAAVAARHVQRPVKFALPRPFHFCTAGHRPVTRQRIQLGATPDGVLAAIRHHSETHTSLVTDYVESCGEATPALYHCDHIKVTHDLIRVNVGTPTSMRAPGACPGLFALECALDELAIKLQADPAELRLKNLPPINEDTKLPWSSIHFGDCIRTATARFGWERRTAAVGSMREGREILGWGFAAATWPAHRSLASAKVELRVDGSAKVSCGTQDIGTGTYTVLAQVVSELTRLPFERIEVAIGDSRLPRGPISGGSLATASLVPAVAEATRRAWQKLPATFREQRLALPEALRAAGRDSVVGEATTEPGDERENFAFRSFGAHCVEVRWDPGITKLRVSRIVSAFDVGRIINRKTATSQIEGALVMGIGMALMEEAVYDGRTGRVVNDNLADYHVPVHADTPAMDVTFLDRPDPHIGDFGARGLGEIGITGTAAAIANAVYHASGKRIRDLPITIEKLLG